ncbi:unnamed protein product [Bursaphelenchus xylophilus]|uniref:(pine wood nematode) hypothetical protein n=1 Tax=Bursaphelenchus xylophilus TaxID=6326 RepID=A0A1I7RK20_BURXY|nr:unnamed protein product [Bursaphelenchus xylophilus]CAG9131567.1 unnamed protein product [Bursaphelenchus xylophilus]
MNRSKLMDSFTLDNLSRISRMKRYYMDENCMNNTELDPCLAAKVRLKHPSDCTCWGFAKFCSALLIALIFVILLIVLLFAFSDRTEATSTTSTTTTTTTTPVPSIIIRPGQDVVEVRFETVFPRKDLYTTTTTTILPRTTTTAKLVYRPRTTTKVYRFHVGTALAPETATTTTTTVTPSIFRTLPTKSIDDAFETCETYLNKGRYKNGVYALNVSPVGQFPAKCVFDKQKDEAWIVIQERHTDDLDFLSKTLKEYGDGFGDPHGDYWLGLKKVHALLQHGRKLVLRLEAETEPCKKGGTSYGELFLTADHEFEITGEDDGYRLNTRFISGNLTDPYESLTKLNGNQFATTDESRGFTVNCAFHFANGGWWHGSSSCAWITFNGRLREQQCGGFKAAIIKKSEDRSKFFYHLKYTRMMVKLV